MLDDHAVPKSQTPKKILFFSISKKICFFIFRKNPPNISKSHFWKIDFPIKTRVLVCFFLKNIFSFCSKKYFFGVGFFFRYNFDVEFPPLSISEGFRAIRVLLHGFWGRYLFVSPSETAQKLTNLCCEGFREFWVRQICLPEQSSIYKPEKSQD